jgi:hypothetical protein
MAMRVGGAIRAGNGAVESRQAAYTMFRVRRLLPSDSADRGKQENIGFKKELHKGIRRQLMSPIF